MIMDEPCFDILRTREQLGYSVYSQAKVTSGIIGLVVAVWLGVAVELDVAVWLGVAVGLVVAVWLAVTVALAVAV